MPSPDNEALVRRFFDAYNQMDDSAFLEIFDPGYVCHVGGMPEPMVGLDANLAAEASSRTAFSDGHWTIDDLVAAGDKVVVRRAWRLNHTGPFQGLPPTGRTLTGTAIDIFRVEDGKITEQWTESDNLSFMQQLGALPAVEREPGL
jgi:predicted ester cyclase